LAIAILAVAPHATATPTMDASPSPVDTIRQICSFVTEHDRTAFAVAQRFGMHLHDEGPSANITFTPRDRRFASGSTGRRLDSQRVHDVDLVVAPNAELTLGMLRLTFGAMIGKGDVGEHANDPWSFTYYLDPHPTRPVACFLTAYVDGKPSLTNPPDDVRVHKIGIVFGPRLGAANKPSSP
jgi:hypothetical protein